MPKVNMERLDERVANIYVDVIEIKKLLQSQNGRVKRLELWRAFQTGALLIIGTIGAFIVKEVWPLLKR